MGTITNKKCSVQIQLSQINTSITLSYQITIGQQQHQVQSNSLH